MDGKLPATKLTIFLTEDDRVGHDDAWRALIERAREDGMAGATLWRGIEGFGRRGRLRSDRFVDAAQGMPLAVELIDEAERVEEFLAVVQQLTPDAFIVRETVHVSTHRRTGTPGLDDPSPRPVTGGA